jgi:putative transposase
VRKFQAREGSVVQAYKFALDPTCAQLRSLASHAGAARVAFNWALARVKANWDQRAAEASYGIAEDDLTPWVDWSLPGLRRAWNQTKRADPRYGWWAANLKESYNTGLANLSAALSNWQASRNGTRKGSQVGFPRFKSKRLATPAVRFTTGAIRVESDRRHVTLPVLGTIKTHESTRKLQRRLADGRARVLSATVRFERGRWFAAFQVEVERDHRPPARPMVAAGVDLGITHLAVIADTDGGVWYEPNPRHLDHALKDLAQANRRLSRRVGPTGYDPDTGAKTQRTPSRRWEKAKARLAQVHTRVADLRADGLHQLTTALTREYGVVVLEDLHVAGMVRNHRLARHLSDASFGEFRRQITYKAG